MIEQKKYTLTVTDDDDLYKIKSRSKGFTSYEILGLLTSKVMHIREQIKGTIKPKIEYTRTVVKKRKTKK